MNGKELDRDQNIGQKSQHGTDRTHINDMNIRENGIPHGHEQRRDFLDADTQEDGHVRIVEQNTGHKS